MNAKSLLWFSLVRNFLSLWEALHHALWHYTSRWQRYLYSPRDPLTFGYDLLDLSIHPPVYYVSCSPGSTERPGLLSCSVVLHVAWFLDTNQLTWILFSSVQHEITHSVSGTGLGALDTGSPFQLDTRHSPTSLVHQAMPLLTSNHIFTLGPINQAPNLTNLHYKTRRVMADPWNHIPFQRHRAEQCKHSL